jgi:tetratricopeptide (TPR) repeat protein
VADALLLEWYRGLPHFKNGDDPDLWAGRMHKALRGFRRRIRLRYSEGTLQRMLDHPSAEVRRAAVLALGLAGTIQSNPALAKVLHDEDELTARTASDSLWEIWFRGGPQDANSELQRILHLPEGIQTLEGLTKFIGEWPDYAEAWNQRAILWFQNEEYKRSLADCQRALRLNPHHFGAQAGMGQCYLKMRKFNAALRAFKLALEMNPTLDHLTGTIEALQNAVDDS